MQRAIIYDDGLETLGPLTDLRASFDVRTGARTTMERLAFSLDLQVIGLAVPMGLVDITAERHGPGRDEEAAVFCHTGLPSFEPGTVLINGRCVLPIEEISNLELGQCLVEQNSNQVIAVRPDSAESARAFMGGGKEAWAPPKAGSAMLHERQALMHKPWHVRTFLEEALNLDLIDMASNASEPQLRGVMAFGEAPLQIHDTAKVYPGVTFDVENGPVVVDEHAVLRPGCVIIGPSYVGPHATVIDRALIKSHTSIGPWCKVGGEVGATIFQACSNKSHDGHLGDSYIGEWVNLGAATNNSNLLNTYGDVPMRWSHGASLERTGRQFMGCIVGDHVKTAIGTRIMTGAVLGTGVMYAATVPATGAIPPFAWVTDESAAGTKGKYYRPEKFLEIARTVMQRRKQVMTDAYARRIAELCRS